MVSTLDFESSDPSSNLGRTLIHFFHAFCVLPCPIVTVNHLSSHPKANHSTSSVCFFYTNSLTCFRPHNYCTEIIEPHHEISSNVVRTTRKGSDQPAHTRFCKSLEYYMTVKLMTEQHLEFLSLKGGFTGSYESTLVKMPNFWNSHVAY